METQSPPKSGIGYMLLAVLFFSITHASVKAVSHLPFYELVFCRAIISFSLCWYAIQKLKISPWGHDKKVLLARGAAGTAALLAYFYTLQTMPLASAVSIQYLSPLFTTLLAVYLLKEKVNSKTLLCFVGAIIGVVLVKGFDPRVSLLDLGIGFFAAIGSAVAYNLVRMLKETDHPMVVVFYFPLVTIPVVGPFAIRGWVWPQGWDWLFVLAVGVFTQLAQVNMTKAFQLEKAARVSILNYLGLVLALVVGFLAFGETFDYVSLTGMLLIVLSIVISTLMKPS